MTAPKRIQRQRTRGWHMPPGAVYVGRPTRWGNPYTPQEGFGWRRALIPGQTVEDCVLLYRCHWQAMLTGSPTWREHAEQSLAMLRGRDLACWCRLGQACHADVLLDLANLPTFKCEAS